MSPPNQRTVAKEFTLSGPGVHSGENAHLTVRPSGPGTGIRFRRTDVEGAPDIPADLDHVDGTELGTSLSCEGVRVATVEHLMAALSSARIDNATVELDGPEVPIRDGSFREYADALADAGAEEQDAAAFLIQVKAPVSVAGAHGQSYLASPGSGLTVKATIDFDHRAIGKQVGSFIVDPESFRTELAPARTFGFRADEDALHARGLALGASLENTVVLDENGVMNEGLRFDDEFLRHKVGDLLGDLALLGARTDAHITVERPSHAGNIGFARAIAAHIRHTNREAIVDINKIMEFLPHRYPMLLVDRITEYEPGKRIVGIKNVTINEPFFQGHYPGHPIMPGVLIIEAMAQVGGLLLMDEVGETDDKVVYFMSLDKVKWRKPVTPGDTIVFELEMLQFRRQVCKMKGRGYVEGALVAEAELMATIVDR